MIPRQSRKCVRVRVALNMITYTLRHTPYILILSAGSFYLLCRNGLHTILDGVEKADHLEVLARRGRREERHRSASFPLLRNEEGHIQLQVTPTLRQRGREGKASGVENSRNSHVRRIFDDRQVCLTGGSRVSRAGSIARAGERDKLIDNDNHIAQADQPRLVPSRRRFIAASAASG